MKIRTNDDIQSYKQTFNSYSIPEITESILVDERHVRVTGFYCPVIRVVDVPRVFDYNSIKKLPTGRSIYIGGRCSYGNNILSNIQTIVEKTRHVKFDYNEWIRIELEKSIEEENKKLAQSGDVLLRPCIPEEATHISHYAICKGMTRIDKVERTYELCWGENKRDDEYKSWKIYVDKNKNSSFFYSKTKP